MALFGALFLALLAGAQAELPGCKIRITSKALELGKARGRMRAGEGGVAPAVGARPKGLAATSVKQEGLRFLEQELETITIPDLRGKEGYFYYNISE